MTRSYSSILRIRPAARGLPVREAILRGGRLSIATGHPHDRDDRWGACSPCFLNISGGAEFWQPLTGAVVFGLAFATVLTLVVIPCAYSLYYRRFTRMEWLLGVPLYGLVVAAFAAFVATKAGDWRPAAAVGAVALLLLASVVLTSKEEEVDATAVVA